MALSAVRESKIRSTFFFKVNKDHPVEELFFFFFVGVGYDL